MAVTEKQMKAVEETISAADITELERIEKAVEARQWEIAEAEHDAYMRGCEIRY